MNNTKRIEELERKNVENTNTIEEFEYLVLTDYSVRANSYVVVDENIQLYDDSNTADIVLNPCTFNTTMEKMKYLLDKYNFKVIA